MITTRQSALIRTAFDSLPDLPLSGMRDGKEMLYQTCLASEREHRRPVAFRPRQWGISATQVAGYFTVRWLRDAVLRVKPVHVSEYLAIRQECFLAMALAHHQTLRPILDRWLITAEWADAFDALDYVELCKGRDEK